MAQSRQIRIASLNTLNLRAQGQPIYQEPGYTPTEYIRKISWLASMLDTLDSDLVGLQEVFDEQALVDTLERCADAPHYSVARPASEADSDLPRVALVSRLEHLSPPESIELIPPGFVVDLPGAPELGIDAIAHQRFSRPLLSTTVNLGTGGATVPAQVFVVHLKSRRPKRLSDERRGIGEDLDNPEIEARAHLRSLLMRAAEAGGIRSLLLEFLHRSRMPVIALGDFNDHAKAATTNLIAGRMAPKDLSRRDIQLYHASALQPPNVLTRRVGYTKIHLGEPDSIDHILLSEEFLRDSRHAIAQVERVDYFNDHLNTRDRLASDHGAIRATLRLR